MAGCLSGQFVSLRIVTNSIEEEPRSSVMERKPSEASSSPTTSPQTSFGHSESLPKAQRDLLYVQQLGRKTQKLHTTALGDARDSMLLNAGLKVQR